MAFARQSSESESVNPCSDSSSTPSGAIFYEHDLDPSADRNSPGIK